MTSDSPRLRPIDYWHMLEDFARFMRPEIESLLSDFLAVITRPGFNPGHECVLVYDAEWLHRTFARIDPASPPTRADRSHLRLVD
jgi:hypothetical protein